MSKVLSWVDRKFDLDFPAGLYPNFISRLRGAPLRAAELGRSFSHAERIRRPSDGKWSAQENIGHLVDLDGLWMKRVGDYMAGRVLLTAWDSSNPFTFEAGHNSRDWDELVTDFATVRGELVRRLEALEAHDFERTAQHPRLQIPMRLADAVYFTAEHDDNHLAIAWELLHQR